MNIFRATKIENAECEHQAKFVQERIISSEEKLASLCSAFGAYLQKNCRVRDASDDISSAIYKFAADETISKSLKFSLLKFAEFMAIIGDLRDSQITHIEQDVVKEFLQYNTLCRNARAEIRSIFSVKEHELNRRRQLGKVRLKNPHNKNLITQAEIELSKAAAESSQVQRELEEHIIIFEKKKLVDLKTVLLEFVMAELRFHAEALEVYTEAYKALNKVNIDDDLQAFKNILKQSPNVSRLEIVKKNMEAKNTVTASPMSFTSENTSLTKTPTEQTLQPEEVESFHEQSSEEYTTDESEESSSESNSQVAPLSPQTK